MQVGPSRSSHDPNPKIMWAIPEYVTEPIQVEGGAHENHVGVLTLTQQLDALWPLLNCTLRNHCHHPIGILLSEDRRRLWSAIVASTTTGRSSHKPPTSTSGTPWTLPNRCPSLDLIFMTNKKRYWTIWQLDHRIDYLVSCFLDIFVFYILHINSY